MTNFNFFNANRMYNELFYQFPKVLVASDQYTGLSDSAKLAYMVLKARLEFAIKKNQIDEDGNIYFTFTISELCKLLKCGKQKAIGIKSQLEEYGLLYQKQMGFNKKLGKNNPNRLYLAELTVTENDIYQVRSFEEGTDENVDKSEGMKIIPCPEEKTTAQSLGAQEGMKIIPCQNVDKSEGMKIIPVLNNLSTDTLDTLDTEKEQIRQKILLDQFAKIQKQTFLNEPSLHLISVFSDTIQEAHAMVGTIQRAKAAVEKEYETVVIAEAHELEIETCLRRVLHKIKTDATVRSPAALMFTSFKNEFTNCILQKDANKQRLEKDSKTSLIAVYDWVKQI